MGDIKSIQKAYSKQRKQIADKDLALQKAKAALDHLNGQEKQALSGPGSQAGLSRREAYHAQQAALSAQIEKLSSEKKSLVASLRKLAGSAAIKASPQEKIKELDDGYPILMFPLRLETRFTSTGDQQQLWLRVYPDDCNINRKEELLSESELANAKAFWIEMWKAGSLEAEERGAWRSLVNSHGSGRSAWIIEQYQPVNHKPAKPDAQHKILVVLSPLALSEAEHQAATAYWAAVWLAKGDSAALGLALNALQASVGDAKAHDINENYVPENILDPVPGSIEARQVLLEKLELPPPEGYTTTRASWTQAPKAIALPDRFVAIACQGNNKNTVPFDHPVREDLSVGPDPSLTDDTQIKKDANGDLLLQEDLKWMVDFETAIQAGMGVKINLTAEEAAIGFDRLFVVGLRLSTNSTDSKALLEKLLTDHFQSQDGLGLLKQGTPTNNTEEEPAGYSWMDDPDESFNRIFKHSEAFEEKAAWTAKSDGHKLADFLRIDPAILKKVPHANGRDQVEAYAMNTALFPATLGYFMEEMMHPLFSDEDIEVTKVFFSSFVSGRGPLPALRIARQPYGILPVSVYSRLQFNGSKKPGTTDNTKLPYQARLHQLIMKMDAAWDTVLPQVPYIGKEGDPYQVLLDVVGLHANSVEFHQRYAQSFQQMYNQSLLQTDPLQALIIAAALAERGNSIVAELGIDLQGKKLPILEKYFIGQPNLLSGPLIDDVPHSEFNPIRSYTPDDRNYIAWLATSDAETIRTQNFGGSPAPNALLYLLLRHALMQAQADAATQLLVAKNLVTSKKAFFDPDFIHVQMNGGGKSKLEHLYSTNASITGSTDMKIVDHIYLPHVLQEASETKRLRETLEALQVLAATPTARLERLLVEHLDCCNYRIDAWKTGLATLRLLEQKTGGKKKAPEGLYLGAYGWLMDVKPANKILGEQPLSGALNEIFNKDNNKPVQTDPENLGYIHAPSLNQAATAAILRNAYDSNKHTGSGNAYAINLTSDRVRIANSFLEGMRNGQSLAALLGYQFERGLHDSYNLGQGEVNQFIYPLRKAFPLVADNLENTKSDASASIETIEANNVMDGLKLMHHVQNAALKDYPFGLAASYNLPPAAAHQALAINKEVKRLTEIHDAISDLVIAEQVYQVVQGNFERASGTAEAFSKGSYPPETDIMNTPRSGHTLSQRMAIHADAEAAADKSPYYDETAHVEPLAMTPRAKAEPSINKWLSSIFPQPEAVLCKVTYHIPRETNIHLLVSQKDLGLQPIDLLYCFDLDTGQAMTELEDRITHYVHYTISRHPKSDININYTAQIDPADKTKVSFFELAALVKSLRKILIGSRHLDQAAVRIPASGDRTPILLNEVQLKTRITALAAGLAPLAAGLESIISRTRSIAGLSAALKGQLKAHLVEPSAVEAITHQLTLDLKDYLTDPAATRKAAILASFENSLPAIGNAGIIATLKQDYETRLDAYLADFLAFDSLVKETGDVFLHLALYDNSQTGTGFIHQGISGMYDRVFAKLDKVLERWEDKTLHFNALMSAYTLLSTQEEQFKLLQKAEALISAQITFPAPLSPAAYQIIISAKKASFDSLLNQLKSLKTNPQEKVSDFIAEAETYLNNIGQHDVITFDPENARNDLKAEKLLIALLKEDIQAALDNLKASLTEKMAAAAEFVAAADKTVLNSDKITALQEAAKKLLGEEALLLPHFTLSETQANEFESAYHSSDQLLDFVKRKEGRIFPVEDWLGGVARVREKVHHWENTCFLANAFNHSTMPEVMPLQFPYQETDRWLALKFRDEADATDTFRITGDKLLYTAHFATPFNPAKPQCGLILDEWVEVIPAPQETTGIAFHYDQPNSEPPQTMMLVVPPERRGNWQWEDITDALEETLQMAKKRAVEPAQVEKTMYAQFLPTTMMAVSLYWITVATNLALNNDIYKKIEND